MLTTEINLLWLASCVPMKKFSPPVYIAVTVYVCIPDTLYMSIKRSAVNNYSVLVTIPTQVATWILAMSQTGWCLVHTAQHKSHDGHFKLHSANEDLLAVPKFSSMTMSNSKLVTGVPLL